MKKSEAFPTRFLSAADLKGKAITVTIQSTTRETLKSPEGKIRENGPALRRRQERLAAEPHRLGHRRRDLRRGQ